MNVSRHDSDFAFAWTDDAGTVWTDQSRSFAVKVFPHLHHIQRRNAFGDTNYNRDTSVSSFHDCIRGESRRDVNHRRVCAGLLYRIRNGVEYRNVFMCRPAFAGCNTTYDIRSILNHLFCMKRTFFAGEPLHYQTGRLVNQNAQCIAPVIELKK